MLQKTNLLVLSKEANEKDRSLKTQFLLSKNSGSIGKISEEAVWRKQGFFSDEKADFNLEKRISLKVPSVISIRDIFQGLSGWVEGGRGLVIYNHIHIGAADRRRISASGHRNMNVKRLKQN